MHIHCNPQLSAGEENSCTVSQTFFVEERQRISALVKEIVHLTRVEENLEGKKQSLHAEEIALMFEIGRKIQLLRETSDRYMADLALAGVPYVSAVRYRHTWIVFGKYRHESWINNFGKSALGKLANDYFSKSNNYSTKLIDEAIALAKAGVEVGVAWVITRLSGKEQTKRQEEKVKAWLSKQMRKAIHQAIDLHGEEKVLQALAQLGGEE